MIRTGETKTDFRLELPENTSTRKKITLSEKYLTIYMSGYYFQIILSTELKYRVCRI